MECQVAILAGGMGSRLKSRMGDLPKPMAPISGKPVLEHQINLCAQNGFTRIALFVHYESEKIRGYFGTGSNFGVDLTYVVETEARGTAGALLDGLDVMASRFLVLYGDTYADVDLRLFWKLDCQKVSSGSLLIHPNDHPGDSDLMELDDRGALISVHPYPHPEGINYSNLVNAALYILDKKSLLEVISAVQKTDLAKHTFPALLAMGKTLFGYVTPEYIKDMGTPDRLDKVERDINFGLPEMLSGRRPRKAVFLDRDGTINLEVNHLNSADQLMLIDGAAEAIRLINRSGMLAIGVTNQPVLARGEVTYEGLRQIHSRLDNLLGRNGAYLDRIYICPHHPDGGFLGEVPELKIKCTCRKPKTGLFDKAVDELNISRRDSWMVGDSTADILAAKRAGLRSILIKTGYAGRDFKYDVSPDFIANDLAHAVDWILGGHANAVYKLMPIVASVVNPRLILVGGPSRSGKSSIANVLAELFELVGIRAHVLPMDGWLKAAEDRHEGAGILSRYKLDAMLEEAKKIATNPNRFSIRYTQYDSKIKQVQAVKSSSIGPSDVVILEGVPALLDDRLIGLANARIYVDIDDDVRIQRLRDEYIWRGEDEKAYMQKINSREKDEVLAVKESAYRADYLIRL